MLCGTATGCAAFRPRSVSTDDPAIGYFSADEEPMLSTRYAVPDPEPGDATASISALRPGGTTTESASGLPSWSAG